MILQQARVLLGAGKVTDRFFPLSRRSITPSRNTRKSFAIATPLWPPKHAALPPTHDAQPSRPEARLQMHEARHPTIAIAVMWVFTNYSFGLPGGARRGHVFPMEFLKAKFRFVVGS